MLGIAYAKAYVKTGSQNEKSAETGSDKLHKESAAGP